MRVDYLIIGQGLAGTALATVLIETGKRVLVVDDGHLSAASRAAAGIINPVTGKRLAKSWKADLLLPSALEFYREWEGRHGTKVFHARSVLRFLSPEQERRHWPRRLASGELEGYYSEEPAGVEPWVRATGKPVEFHPAGYVDTGTFLAVSARELAGKGSLRREPFDCAQLRIENNGVCWRDVRAKKVIFCEGYKAARNPYFDWLPFTSSKGEILTLNAPRIPPTRILNNGKWLLPTSGGEVRVGATYAWDRLDERPTDTGKRELLGAYETLVNLPPEVIDHRAGVRSAVKDTKPVIGLHPGHSAIGIFNGLGSKGVLTAPCFARQFAAYLETGAPLDDEVDVRRNF